MKNSIFKIAYIDGLIHEINKYNAKTRYKILY